MKLASFMNQRLEELLGAWDEAAAHIYPGVDGLSPKALRNSAREILLAVVEDLSAQPLAGDDERLRARGQLPAHAPSMTETARSHAAERFSQGFTVNNVVAEFCALRESVISRWIAVSTPTTADELADLRRFDHAIDQALAASVRCFDERAQEARDLLAGALAHDLRTPVGAIAVSAQVLLASV